MGYMEIRDLVGRVGNERTVKNKEAGSGSGMSGKQDTVDHKWSERKREACRGKHQERSWAKGGGNDAADAQSPFVNIKIFLSSLQGDISLAQR